MSKETIYIALKLTDKFNVAFPDGFIPEGVIDKSKCRVGITWQAFHENRHTIIVVPGTQIIEDALLNYPDLNLFAVMEGVTPELAKEAMRLAAHKLPLKTMFVQRHTVKATVAVK